MNGLAYENRIELRDPSGDPSRGIIADDHCSHPQMDSHSILRTVVSHVQVSLSQIDYVTPSLLHTGLEGVLDGPQFAGEAAFGHPDVCGGEHLSPGYGAEHPRAVAQADGDE